MRACSLVVLGLLACDIVDLVLAAEGEAAPEGVLDEAGGRSVVAAVSAVAVLLALECVAGLLRDAADDGSPPEDVGRLALLLLLLILLVEGTLRLVLDVVVAPADCWPGTCRIEGALPSGLAVALSGPVGARCLVAVVVVDVVGLLENIPESGLPEAVVVVLLVLVAELAALLRAAAVVDDDVVAEVTVPDLVKGLTWGSRLGDELPDSLALLAPSLWAN